MLCSPCVPDIHRLVRIPGQCSCTLLSAPLLMRAWHSLHITIKAQTQKHIVHWTHLLRAFPYHGSGALNVVLMRNGESLSGMTEPTGARMQHDVGADFKSWGGMTTGRCGQQGSERTQSWQVGPVCSRWRKRRMRRSRWLASLDAIRLGKIIYAVLLTKTEGKVFSIVHLTPRGAGDEAWRLLRAEHAGSSGVRLGNMVREVVCPRDQWMADVSAGKDFLTSLIEWEIKVAAYEVASGDRFSEAVRVATIMDHALDAVKSMLRLSPLEQRRSVDALKVWIRESSYASPGLFQGSIPMQAGAVSDGGKGKKGKSKSTGEKGTGKGKGKGKCKDKNKHKGNDGNKNKERDDWNKGQRQAKFQGYCSHCSKWGHKRADCRTRLAQQKKWCSGWRSRT